MTTKTITGIVGIALGNAHLSYVHGIMDKGTYRVAASGTVPFKVNPATDSPELTGREIHQALISAGIKERNCVMCLPTNWLLTMPVEIPAGLIGDDLDSYLKLQAEQELCFANGDALLTLSRNDGDSTGTLIATSAERVNRMLLISRFAKLRVTALVPSVAVVKGASDAVVFISELGIEVMTSSGHCVRQLRTLIQPNGSLGIGDVDDTMTASLVRELKISFGRNHGKALTIELAGRAAEISYLKEALQEDMPEHTWLSTELPKELLFETEAAMLQLPAYHAGRCLLENVPLPIAFEGVAKRRNAFSLDGKHSLKLYRKYAIAGVALVAILLITYLAQWGQLIYMRNACDTLRPQSLRVDSMRKEVKLLNTWFATRPDSLTLLNDVTSAFPEDGDVWVTELSVDDDNKVQLRGKAKSRSAWLSMHNNLQKKSAIHDLRIQQSRTDSKKSGDLSFSLNFSYNPGG